MRHLIWFSEAEVPWVDRREFYHHMGGTLVDRNRTGDISLNW